MRIFISAGEASGDLYASKLVEILRARHPAAEFFGCAGPKMQKAGVRPIVDSRSLAVVGIVEVIGHIPRIYGLFRKLLAAAKAERPDLAILTDAPDFHLRLAKKLKKQGIPIVYLIAPQAWAWRGWRVHAMKRSIDHLLCIFPFEELFFAKKGLKTTFIGHPLAKMAHFSSSFPIPEKPMITLLPGSRHGEAERHMPVLIDAVERLGPKYSYLLALPQGFGVEKTTFWERIRDSSIQVKEGCTWDALAHSELALAASGTVTIEAALAGAPMVSFYKVNALSWILGRRLVRAPFLSMVNLVAGKKIVPELIQRDMTAERIAEEARRILENAEVRERMRADLAEVARKLDSERDPMEVAAEWIERVFSERKETVPAG